jgi:hypothetical protein
MAHVPFVYFMKAERKPIMEPLMHEIDPIWDRSHVNLEYSCPEE